MISTTVHYQNMPDRTTYTHALHTSATKSKLPKSLDNLPNIVKLTPQPMHHFAARTRRSASVAAPGLDRTHWGRWSVPVGPASAAFLRVLRSAEV